MTPGGWFTEDVHLEVVGEPDGYALAPTGPVTVSAVRRNDAVSGYLWADDTADAAGFLPAPSGGDEAMNAAVSYRSRLRDAKARGLRPTQALQEIVDDGPTALGEPQPIEPEPTPFAALQERAGPVGGQDWSPRRGR
jgi:hypothetical protein